MKMSELTFADMAVLEIAPAYVKQFHYFGPNREVDAARDAYKFADALSAERERRADRRDHELETLRARAERAEASYSVLLNMEKDGVAPRIALSQIREFLGTDNQTDTMHMIRNAFPELGRD